MGTHELLCISPTPNLYAILMQICDDADKKNTIKGYQIASDNPFEESSLRHKRSLLGFGSTDTNREGCCGFGRIIVAFLNSFESL